MGEEMEELVSEDERGTQVCDDFDFITIIRG